MLGKDNIFSAALGLLCSMGVSLAVMSGLQSTWMRVCRLSRCGPMIVPVQGGLEVHTPPQGAQMPESMSFHSSDLDGKSTKTGNLYC